MRSKYVLLAGVLAITVAAVAQSQRSPKSKQALTTDVAVTLDFEHAQIAQVNGNRFWIKGGSADGSVTFWRGLGVAANLVGEHASKVNGDVGLGKIAFMVGPRYTFEVPQLNVKQHNTRAFAETLFGTSHGFDSAFPGTGGVKTSASAFSMQMGGGIDVAVEHGVGIRALEMDWVHTALPNNASNVQNDLRIAFGVSYRR